MLSSSVALADELKITIADVPDSSGSLMVALMASEGEFKDTAPAVASMILPARQGSVALTLHDVEPGEYAVRVMHDQNGNQKLDANMIGIPREPWGFSNNAAGSFGPPGWKDVTFTVEGHKEITINLNQ
ncbi:MAG: DUF2141 domain-containing protein [Proteobacteria bacterium]|nr:DUF2141 domain-containing protein [Pseudomonadota bacterium]